MAYIIGITGPSGAGKSLFSKYIVSASIPCIDADELYHSMLVPPSSCLDEIARVFGKDVIASDGTLDRAALSLRVFGDPQMLVRLNETVLPLVIEKIKKEIARYEQSGHRVVAVDAPTLIESGFNKECNAVIAVIAPADERTERIKTRDHISLERARERITAQKSDEFYTSAADFIIVNDADEPSFLKKAEDILRQIKNIIRTDI
ncbi:MAG: dephospho-CoA kinase [Clostridia bacterium]|nr:dephospho-CoA kinase [Clostridia bacterium]